MQRFSHFAQAFSTLFGAQHCMACGLHRGDPFCNACTENYFSTQTPRCRRCAISLTATVSEQCGQCLSHPPSFDATLTCADYAAPVNSMVLALKSGGRLALARAFGRLLAQRVPADWINGALIVPVPLAFERHKTRGFNQSHEIGCAFAAACGQSLRDDVLVRTRHAPPQQQLKLDARRRNLRGAFSVQAPVRDQKVLVIDDVMTTGSTLEEIAQTLKRAGCKEVFNVVVARTP